MGVLHKEHPAGPGAHHLHAVPQLGGKGQGLAEDAPLLQPLQDGPGSGQIKADQLRLALHHHAHLLAAVAVGADGLPGLKGVLAHVEAADHGLHLPVRDVPENLELAVVHGRFPPHRPREACFILIVASATELITPMIACFPTNVKPYPRRPSFPAEEWEKAAAAAVRGFCGGRRRLWTFAARCYRTGGVTYSRRRPESAGPDPGCRSAPPNGGCGSRR